MCADLKKKKDFVSYKAEDSANKVQNTRGTEYRPEKAKNKNYIKRLIPLFKDTQDISFTFYILLNVILQKGIIIHINKPILTNFISTSVSMMPNKENYPLFNKHNTPSLKTQSCVIF